MATTAKTKKKEVISTVEDSVKATEIKELEQKENEALAEAIEEKEIRGESDSVNFEKLEEAINNVDTTINTDDFEKSIEEDIKKMAEPIKKINEKINEINAAQSTFAEKITKNESESIEIVQNEIKAVEALKSNVEKIINSTNNSSVTSWWNGMGFNL